MVGWGVGDRHGVRFLRALKIDGSIFNIITFGYIFIYSSSLHLSLNQVEGAHLASNVFMFEFFALSL